MTDATAKRSVALVKLGSSWATTRPAVYIPPQHAATRTSLTQSPSGAAPRADRSGSVFLAVEPHAHVATGRVLDGLELAIPRLARRDAVRTVQRVDPAQPVVPPRAFVARRARLPGLRGRRARPRCPQ